MTLQNILGFERVFVMDVVDNDFMLYNKSGKVGSWLATLRITNKKPWIPFNANHTRVLRVVCVICYNCPPILMFVRMWHFYCELVAIINFVFLFTKVNISSALIVVNIIRMIFMIVLCAVLECKLSFTMIFIVNCVVDFCMQYEVFCCSVYYIRCDFVSIEGFDCDSELLNSFHWLWVRSWIILFSSVLIFNF